MTSQKTLTYMATDIVGYSLLTQKDQRKTFVLIETYQSILIPLIKNEGGTSIVCTADAITACFSSCLSAIRAGFAIQDALSDWNRSSATLMLATRIGVHTSRHDAKGHLQQLSKTVAKSLESHGSEKALNVSLPVLEEIKDESWLYFYPLGSRELDYLPEPLRMFYLFENKPGLFNRLILRSKYLKYEYINRFTKAYILTASMSAMILAAVLFFNPAVVNSRSIEFSKIIDLSEDGDNSYAHALSRRISSRLAGLSRVTVLSKKLSHSPATRLVCSFQKYGDNVRLTWSIFKQAGGVQSSGGVVSGESSDLEDVEMRMLENILAQID